MPDIFEFAQFHLRIENLNVFTYVVRFEGTESISEPFQFDVLISTEDHDIRLADVVGKNATLTLQPGAGASRHVNGIVSRFRHVEDGKNVSLYLVTVVPKLWRLRYRQTSRIFQEMTVPDILVQVLESAGLSDQEYRLALSGSYSPREYCVQYRESDITFLSRLTEEEGIFYFFEHTDDSHVLVIADSKDATVPMASPDTLPFRAPLGAMARSECVSRFSCTEEVRPGKVTLNDFNFKKPSLSLLESNSTSLDSDLEVYEFPGEYDLPGDGKTLAKVRLEEWQARRIVADGDSGCFRLTPGYLFRLSECARDEENSEYLVTRVQHRGSQPQMGEAATGDKFGYLNTFHCIPSNVPYRPERRTPKPTIRGVQTAIVTGPDGEEVHTDEHGRVKVHFHWDRFGAMDDKSSCWIRVSQIWAGAGWGAMWIPRIGHEVVVDFIEGDPDRPLIVGRVYHGANVPPYPLPAEKTKSTIKSNSSRGGDGFNELRFEDKKGQEEIFLHGQKDWTIRILHDEDEDVGNDAMLHVGRDQKERVDNDRSASVGANEHLDVGGDRDERIDGADSLSVGKNRTVTVSGAHSETVGEAQSVAIGGAQSIAVGEAQAITVADDKTENVGGHNNEGVGKNKSTTVGEHFMISTGKDMKVEVGKNAVTEVKDEKTLVVGKKLKVQVGDAMIQIEKNGNITVQGKKIIVKGDGPIQVEGKKLSVKSEGAVNVEASGKVKIKGSQVGVN